MNAPEPVQMTVEQRRAVLEAEASGNSVLPDAAPARPDAPHAGAPAEPQAPPQPSRGDQQRAAIAEKFAAARNQNQDDSEASMQTGVRAMLAETEGRPMNLEGAPQPQAPQPAAAARAPAAASPPLANEPEMVTLVVDGREMAVSAAEVWRQGMAAAQKLGAADFRLERAATAERQILLERQALDQRAAEIERLLAATPTGVAPAPTSGTLPTGAQPTHGAMKKALDALLDSDVDGAATAFDQAVTERFEARMRAAAPAAAAPSAPAASAVQPLSPWDANDIQRANDVFNTAFPEVAYHPQVMGHAMARMQQEMANPVNINGRVSLEIIAAKIGREFIPMALSMPAPQPNPQPPPQPAPSNVDELAARRMLAARVPGVPPSSTTRSVQPNPGAPPPPSRSDIVKQMRVARGQSTA